MSVKNIVRDLKEVTDGIENVSRREFETKTAHSFEHSLTENENSRLQSLISSDQQSPWAYLPSELLIDVVQRIEASHMSWPARKYIVACASVCRSWREVVKEVVKAPEETGRLTFPISLKQPGPRRNPIRCFVKRERETSTFRLYLGLSPSLMEEDGKLLFSAKRIRRATSTEFIVSLASDDFARASNTYIGRLRSNFLGTKFTIYDAQPQYGTTTLMNSRSIRTIHPNQVAPRAPTGNYNIATISYEINVLRPRGPRRIHCVLHSIPISSILGGTAPTPSRFHNSLEDTIPSSSPNSKNSISSSLTMPISDGNVSEPLILKNKAPRWHEQLHCWCLNFKGRVTVASVKNFQLVAMVDLSDQFFDFEEEKVILQFGKIGKDVFTMDYRYPLSAFQAFAICLSSFGTKPACE